MKRVTGVGGIFVKSKNPKELGEWYRKHLGIEISDWGGACFIWNADNPKGEGMTLFTLFKEDTKYFAPSVAPFMVNFRVADLHGLMAALREEGCQVEGAVEESEFGKFGWVVDPEGNKVELWEPPAGQ